MFSVENFWTIADLKLNWWDLNTWNLKVCTYCQTRTDQLGVEMRERLTWDIRQGVIGSETFFPKHAITITWKNMSFAGGIDNSLFMVSK